MRRLDLLDTNYLIGGSFAFWQRVAGNTTTVNTATPVTAYTADRSGHSTGGATVKNFSILRSTDKPSLNELVYSKQFNCLTAITSYAAADIVQPFFHVVEGSNVQNLVGQKVTFGVFLKSTLAGDIPISFRTAGAGTRSYVTTVNIGAGEINTWVFRKVVVQLEAINFNLDVGVGLQIDVAAVGGTTYQAPSLNQWVAGDYRTASGALNVMASNTTIVRVAGMMLLRGEINLDGTEFVRAGRTLATEFILCLRYYEKSYLPEAVPGSITTNDQICGVRVSGEAGTSFNYKVQKRTTPVFTAYSPVTGASGQVRDPNGAVDRAQQLQVNGFNSFLVGSASIASPGAYHYQFTSDAEY